MKTLAIALCLLPCSLLLSGCPDSGDGPDARVMGPDADTNPDSSVPTPDAEPTAPDAQVATPDGAVSMTLNGCDPSTATDLTGMAMTTITFTFAAYTPPCIRVSAGTDVTFSGSFMAHPLRAGTVVGGVPTEDPTSPITATGPMGGGMTATFNMTNTGAFGFYCNFHVGMGMMGAIFVE